METAETTGSGALGAVLASFGIGAALGWLRSKRQQVASVAGAAALALAPAAAPAIVDYDAVLYLGGTDKVDPTMPTCRPTGSSGACTRRPQARLPPTAPTSRSRTSTTSRAWTIRSRLS